METIIDIIMKYALPHLVDAVLAGLSIAVAWIFNEIRVYIKEKVKNEQAQAALQKLVFAIESEVHAAEGTLSKDIKEKAADGRITKTEAGDALKNVGTDIYARLRARYDAEIKTLSPDLAQAEAMVRTEIEAAYNRIRKN
jgi:hypothetical protein